MFANGCRWALPSCIPLHQAPNSPKVVLRSVAIMNRWLRKPSSIGCAVEPKAIHRSMVLKKSPRAGVPARLVCSAPPTTARCHWPQPRLAYRDWKPLFLWRPTLRTTITIDPMASFGILAAIWVRISMCSMILFIVAMRTFASTAIASARYREGRRARSRHW